MALRFYRKVREALRQAQCDNTKDEMLKRVQHDNTKDEMLKRVQHDNGWFTKDEMLKRVQYDRKVIMVRHSFFRLWC
jgi:hypothetical protein